MPSGNDEQSESSATAEPHDRRTRKREARRERLLVLAADLVARDGVQGLTMASLAEAADYAPASLYTYFESRSALLAALQQRALHTLAAVAEDHVTTWDRALGALAPPPSPRLAGLAKLWAFSDLFLDAPRRYPREFTLQQDLLTSVDAEEAADAATVVPAAMATLEVPRRLLATAASTGALAPHPPTTDPVGRPIDGDLLRTIAWVVALNGALLTDRLATGLPTTGVALGDELTGALLAGWGAPTDDLTRARDLADGWVR